MNQDTRTQHKLSPPELLMPAGDLERLKFAFMYGADAVYIGAPFFSLRARENDFNDDNIRLGIEWAHSQGKKVYLTVNVFARNLKIKPFEEAIERWVQWKPDALIMSDPGLMMIVRERGYDIPIHLSVQANCMNYRSVLFWKQFGVSRIILSRELRLTEIQEIRQRVPEIELEAFVHGSICIAYSGRCFLSHYMSYRDANQGVCDNSCRYGYHVYHTPKSIDSGEYYLEDLRNRGEFYRIDEDEHGTYIMNAKDLCLLPHLKDIWEAGVVSFKVEGRTKSVYYVSQVARIYRKAIDDMVAGRPFDPQGMVELEKVANRGYHPGFMMGEPTFHAQNYSHSNARFQSQKFGGIVKKKEDQNLVVLEARNQLKVGSTVEVVTPNEQWLDQVVEIVRLKDQKLVDVAHGGAGEYLVTLKNRALVENALVSVVQT
ncbi:MAG: U32 family peptidase C-terminal domain-containing protein [Bdellovibrionaceae bacterium]|nr:U32 family peptidase C-terminal domain-containing protein [Pseudobdellovibrionaceae bacterium]MDW8190560.1 U32 family peptidase C-terminal domain-containing protein [Pseudobdellovibrionaceae bacterium]